MARGGSYRMGAKDDARRSPCSDDGEYFPDSSGTTNEDSPPDATADIDLDSDSEIGPERPAAKNMPKKKSVGDGHKSRRATAPGPQERAFIGDGSGHISSNIDRASAQMEVFEGGLLGTDLTDDVDEEEGEETRQEPTVNAAKFNRDYAKSKGRDRLVNQDFRDQAREAKANRLSWGTDRAQE